MRGATGLLWKTCFLTQIMLLIPVSQHNTINLEEQKVDPCENLTDDDIKTAIKNATRPISSLLV
ncbi:hypothetical protein OROGR_026519 [Orobanche gracilis]